MLQKNRNGHFKSCFRKSSAKNCRSSGDLIENRIAEKITPIGKPKEKEKTNEAEEIYIPPETRQEVIDNLRLFWA